MWLCSCGGGAPCSDAAMTSLLFSFFLSLYASNRSNCLTVCFVYLLKGAFGMKGFHAEQRRAGQK